MADLERIRLVLLGGAGVGKSSILKRFLFKTYTDKYRATVEDLYNREYDLGGVTLKVSKMHSAQCSGHSFVSGMCISATEQKQHSNRSSSSSSNCTQGWRLSALQAC